MIHMRQRVSSFQTHTLEIPETSSHHKLKLSSLKLVINKEWEYKVGHFKKFSQTSLNQGWPIRNMQGQL